MDPKQHIFYRGHFREFPTYVAALEDRLPLVKQASATQLRHMLAHQDSVPLQSSVVKAAEVRLRKLDRERS